MAIAIVTSLCMPVFAVNPEVVVGAMEVAPDFGSWIWSGIKGGADFIGSFISDDICPGGAENPGLNARHDFIPLHTTVNGKTGMFYVCRNCQKAAGEVLEPAYSDYVQDLPATGYNSAGKLVWQPKFSDFDPSTFFLNDRYCLSEVPCDLPDGRVFVLSSGTGLCFEFFNKYYCKFQLKNAEITVPISGHYKQIKSIRASLCDKSENYYDEYLTASQYVGDGDRLSWTCRDYLSFYVLGVAYVYFPVFEILPALSSTGDTYNTTTRPTSITGGNYGIVGDNNEITKVQDNSTIVNETNNTYYNPATGATVPIVDWSYDYSDRSYKVTMESGDTATITYGDENISITETNTSSGDTITNNYTIYYLVDGSGEAPTDCPHNWTETSTTPAACTVPGSKVLTCSLCSQTKTESIPALGHDWLVKQTVTTQYDETGQLTQEGYTIYECSRCQEQYKAASGSGPPVNPADPDASGGGVFSGIFGLLVDFLSFFWKTFKDFTSSGVRAFLDSLKDGTSDIFGLLNPFDWSA